MCTVQKNRIYAWYSDKPNTVMSPQCKSKVYGSIRDCIALNNPEYTAIPIPNITTRGGISPIYSPIYEPVLQYRYNAPFTTVRVQGRAAYHDTRGISGQIHQRRYIVVVYTGMYGRGRNKYVQKYIINGWIPISFGDEIRRKTAFHHNIWQDGSRRASWHCWDI